MKFTQVKNEIILASKSKVRKEILEKNFIDCKVIASNLDEEPIKESLIKNGASPELISKNLAELKAIKIGYATGKGQDAINTRFQKWKIPYDYEILAYDQSTRTEAAEHEQWLLENTEEYKTFEPREEWTNVFKVKEKKNEKVPDNKLRANISDLTRNKYQPRSFFDEEKGLFKNIIKTLNANKLITINQFRAVIKFIEREEPFIDANREQIEKFFSPLIKYPSKEKEIPECYNSLM